VSGKSAERQSFSALFVVQNLMKNFSMTHRKLTFIQKNGLNSGFLRGNGEDFFKLQYFFLSPTPQKPPFQAVFFSKSCSKNSLSF